MIGNPGLNKEAIPPLYYSKTALSVTGFSKNFSLYSIAYHPRTVNLSVAIRRIVREELEGGTTPGKFSSGTHRHS